MPFNYKKINFLNLINRTFYVKYIVFKDQSIYDANNKRMHSNNAD